jgi:hypothetical protein
MDILIDNLASEQDFKLILTKIRLAKNGETVKQMRDRGVVYKTNWGVSVSLLREMASLFKPDHLLALKLWNKQWRETMILAAMLDVPEMVTEEQMDYWTKSLETAEMAEILNAYLWAKTKFSFVKSLEWCRGKKHWVRFAGIHLMGRLALVEKNALDEFFDPFFEVLLPLSKDPGLKQVLYRSAILLGSRSLSLNEKTIGLAEKLQSQDSIVSESLGLIIWDELKSDYIQQSFVKNY